MTLTPFHWAVREGKLAQIDELLQGGADPSSELVTAISYEQDLAVLVRLLDAGADLLADEQARDRLLSHRSTEDAQRVVAKVGPGLLAALTGRLQHLLRRVPASTAAWLLDNGAALTLPPKQLLEAALDRTELLRLLLARGVSARGAGLLPQAADAAKADALERVRLLVEVGGADVGEAAFSSWTALAMAVLKNNKELALWLLGRGADAKTPVGTDNYQWKKFPAHFSPLDYARSKNYGWFITAAGDDSPDDVSLPSDTPGFDGVRTLATLLHGRRVAVEGPEAAKRATGAAAWLERWSREHGGALQAAAEGVVGAGERVSLAIGVVLARADADMGPIAVKTSLDEAKKQLAAIKRDVWTALDEQFGLGIAAQKAETWLIASGPLATACLAYGVTTPPDRHTTTKQLGYWEGADSAQNPHRLGVFGVIEATEESRKVSLTAAAIDARAAKTRALDGAGLLLVARYD